MNNIEQLLDWEAVEQRLVQVLDKKAPLHQELHQLVAGEALILVRNWYGKLVLLLPCTQAELERSQCHPLLIELQQAAGPLALSPWVMCRDELFSASDYWSDPALLPLLDTDQGNSGLQLKLLERQDKERDWLSPVANDARATKKAQRCVFYSVKGGVGRSSALTMLAIELARRGKRVLVVDGDFESPGLSSSVLPAGDGQPAYGVVDWLTAQALGADLQTLNRMALESVVESSPLNAKLGLRGEILVAPAYGQKTEAYVSKLARIYRQSPAGEAYAQRLNDFLQAVESEHQIDMTLFDCRAGIDDTAAAAVTQLRADISFLFAIGTTQTWDSYRLLFRHLQRNPKLLLVQTSNDDEERWNLRQSLRVVSALTPQESGAYVGYFKKLQSDAYGTFSAIYDADDGDNSDALFAPAPDDEDAPHFPMRVMWNEALRAFNPLGQPELLNDAMVRAGFDDFLQKAIALLGVQDEHNA
ncbi:MAG: AAA family ATPase [Simplicispira sp.]|nr:AAA family ATPase [Simplicispira sp.]